MIGKLKVVKHTVPVCAYSLYAYPSMVSELGMVSETAWDRSADGLSEPIFGSFWAPSTPNTQQKQKVIGKNFISGLLTVLRRPVYASDHFKCPWSVHRNYSFLPMYSIIQLFNYWESQRL